MTERKFLNTGNACCNHLKIYTKQFFHKKIVSKSVDGMANSADPVQSAPRLLFLQTDLGLNCLPWPVCSKSKDHAESKIFLFS